MREDAFGSHHVRNARLDHLKTALTAYARRQKVTAENIANVETEGYKAQEYRFEDLLRKASGNNVQGRMTREGHLPVGRQDISRTSGEMEAQDLASTTGSTT